MNRWFNLSLWLFVMISIRCAASDAATPVEPEREVYFNEVNFEAGLSYLRNHPVPLSVLVPGASWSRDLMYTTEAYRLSEDMLLQRLVEAQVQLVHWFREDLAQQAGVPQITWQRLLRINQMVTGEHDDFWSKRNIYNNKPVASQLVMSNLSAEVIDEMIEAVNTLRTAASIDPDNWSFAAQVRLEQPLFVLGDEVYIPLKPKNVKNMMYERALFFESIIYSPQMAEAGIFRNSRGGYDAVDRSDIYKFDAARLYHMSKSAIEKTDEYYVYGEFSLLGDNLFFYLFETPDDMGKNAKDYPVPCLECQRSWQTFLPSSDYKDLIAYSSLKLIAANNHWERKAMFDAALSSLTGSLRPAMTVAGLTQLLADAWRQLALTHIFPDGNGRTLRLLMNSLLIAYGLPPLTCNPDCSPYTHTSKHFMEDVQEAIRLTKHQKPEAEYPEWLKKPKDPTVLDVIRGL